MTDQEAKLRLEVTKLKLSVGLEEYKAVRAEIIQALNAAYQSVNWTVAAIGVVLAAAPFIIENQLPFLLAAPPLFFVILIWIQTRYLRGVFNMSDYIIRVTAPNIRSLLEACASADDVSVDRMLNWEFGGRKSTHSNKRLYLPLEAARFLLPVAAAIVSLLAYVYAAYLTLPSVTWAWPPVVSLPVALHLLVTLVALGAIAHACFALWSVRKDLKKQEEPQKKLALLTSRGNPTHGQES